MDRSRSIYHTHLLEVFPYGSAFRPSPSPSYTSVTPPSPLSHPGRSNHGRRGGELVPLAALWRHGVAGAAGRGLPAARRQVRDRLPVHPQLWAEFGGPGGGGQERRGRALPSGYVALCIGFSVEFSVVRGPVNTCLSAHKCSLTVFVFLSTGKVRERVGNGRQYIIEWAEQSLQLQVRTPPRLASLPLHDCLLTDYRLLPTRTPSPTRFLLPLSDYPTPPYPYPTPPPPYPTSPTPTRFVWVSLAVPFSSTHSFPVFAFLGRVVTTSSVLTPSGIRWSSGIACSRWWTQVSLMSITCLRMENVAHVTHVMTRWSSPIHVTWSLRGSCDPRDDQMELPIHVTWSLRGSCDPRDDQMELPIHVTWSLRGSCDPRDDQMELPIHVTWSLRGSCDPRDDQMELPIHVTWSLRGSCDPRDDQMELPIHVTWSLRGSCDHRNYLKESS